MNGPKGLIWRETQDKTMTAGHYTEDTLCQETTAEYLCEVLGWESVYAYNTETFGPEGTLGRKDDREVVLTRYLYLKLLCHLFPKMLGITCADYYSSYQSGYPCNTSFIIKKAEYILQYKSYDYAQDYYSSCQYK